MRARHAAMALLAAGCGNGGADTDTAAAPSCDSYETTLLADIDSTQWPAGLSEALPAYKDLDGVYYITDCVDASLEHEIKFTTVAQESIEVVTGGIPTGIDCGCTLDPVFGPDNTMVPVGILPQIELFVPGSLDPNGEGYTYTMDGALFGAGQDLLLRACAHRTIDPAEGSEFDDVYFFVRVHPDGTRDMTMMLNTLGSNAPPSECHYTELRPL